MNDYIIIEVHRTLISIPAMLMLVALFTVVLGIFFVSETPRPKSGTATLRSRIRSIDLSAIGYAFAFSIGITLVAQGVMFLLNKPDYTAAADQMNDHFGTEVTPEEFQAAAERIEIIPEREFRPNPVDGYVQPAQTFPPSQSPSKTETESGTRFTLAYDDLTGCTNKTKNPGTVTIDTETAQVVDCPLTFRVTVP